MLIGGFYFYTDFGRIEDFREIREVILDPNKFQTYGGLKPCGGYHPDYNFVVNKASNIVHIQICFGCRELKIIEGKNEYLIDMADGTKELIKELLQGYHKNRPGNELHRVDQAVKGIPTSSADSSPPF